MFQFTLTQAITAFGWQDPCLSIRSTRTPSPPPIMIRPQLDDIANCLLMVMGRDPILTPQTPWSEAPSYHSNLSPLLLSTIDTSLPDNTTLVNDSQANSPINYDRITPQAEDDPITSDNEVVKALIVDDFKWALREGLHKREEMNHTPSPERPLPGILPGPGWQPNTLFSNLLIPPFPYHNGLHVPAPFILCDLTDDNRPTLTASHGWRCPTTLHSLCAKVHPYPQHRLTTKQLFTFDKDEVFMPLVNHVLDWIGDITLEAEVWCYHIMKAKMRCTTTQIGALCEQFLTYQHQAYDCADTLADTDAYM